jgi:hypothetical protein
MRTTKRCAIFNQAIR